MEFLGCNYSSITESCYEGEGEGEYNPCSRWTIFAKKIGQHILKIKPIDYIQLKQTGNIVYPTYSIWLYKTDGFLNIYVPSKYANSEIYILFTLQKSY